MTKCGELRKRPTVLWCYKKELSFSSHKKKRMKQIKQLKAKGMYDEKADNPFEQFVSATEIRYCFYKATETILGNTYGMLVLQDFESITPNVLCRTVETVEGGGAIIILLNTMQSLRQLYAITMDVHDRFRTDSHASVEPRFNERFILSLGRCQNCIVMDDELNVLPISSHIRDFPREPEPAAVDEPAEGSPQELAEAPLKTHNPLGKELPGLKAGLKAAEMVGKLVDLCRTHDQGATAVQLINGISEKKGNLTMAITAARGRGKSAAIGIGLASAIVYGYSNILVTAPHPSNVTTLFEFLLKGIESLGYREHTDYEILEGAQEEWKGCVVRINVFRNHRQTVQYIEPGDYQAAMHAELLAIDEAAAIPLPTVKKLLGPYIVVLSSTIHGYEGTGRSLSVKLFQELRHKALPGHAFQEAKLNEPIRYGVDDSLEKWLYDLLCLDATDVLPLTQGLPHPSACNLYYVNRDTLFSGHPLSEQFLKKMWSLFVSSHYKNSPNDLQLLSDAPAHCIFVLLNAQAMASDARLEGLPDVLCAIQCSVEGGIMKAHIAEQLGKGFRPAGDLIPWTICEQYQDFNFGELTGVRIVRIATHPDAQGMGYGSRALELLQKYYEGALVNADEIEEDEATALRKRLAEPVPKPKPKDESEDRKQLLTEVIKPKKGLKPLLQALSKRKPLPVHYLGTSYGITAQLYNFWKKSGFISLYVRQTVNELTGEHTCVMVKPLQSPASHDIALPKRTSAAGPEGSWIAGYASDFKKRFAALLGYEFRGLPVTLAMAILNISKSTNEGGDNKVGKDGTRAEVESCVSVYDVSRLESYTKNLTDYHMILDLMPAISRLYLLGHINCGFSYLQLALFIGLGLQFKKVEQISEELAVGTNQLMAMFNKAMRKVCRVIRDAYEKDIAAQSTPGQPAGKIAIKAALKAASKTLSQAKAVAPAAPSASASASASASTPNPNPTAMATAMAMATATATGTETATAREAATVPAVVGTEAGSERPQEVARQETEGGEAVSKKHTLDKNADKEEPSPKKKKTE